MMVREPNFLNTSKLSDTIKATFNRRGTQKTLFIQFNEKGMLSLQALWNNHLRGLGLFRARLIFPEKISDAIDEINNWISSAALHMSDSN